ncbi:MAG: hypothetical protein WBD16_09095 [Pyrinomonadaceae bacterium]
MLRIILGVIAGFIGWVIVWVGVEKILIAVLPEWYGAPQLAFQAAVENGPDASGFMPETRLLLVHIVIGSIVSVMAGSLAALTAGENKRTPLVVGCLLMALGILKAVMSWQYVPIWYHVIFTAMLLPMAIVGGKLITAAK